AYHALYGMSMIGRGRGKGVSLPIEACCGPIARGQHRAIGAFITVVCAFGLDCTQPARRYRKYAPNDATGSTVTTSTADYAPHRWIPWHGHAARAPLS